VRTYGASVVLRSDRLVRREPSDDLIFSLHLEGEGTVLQDARHAGLTSGSGALYDASRPYELRFPTDTRQLVLQTSRDRLRERVGRLDDVFARELPARHPTLRVLAAYVRALADAGGDLSDAEKAEMGSTTVDLLATVLRPLTGSRSVAGAGRTALLVAMRAHVQAHLADPGLTRESLARRHRISTRYATELFADAGTSPAAFIRAERLRAAHRLLSDPGHAGATVSAVAARSGFTDRTTFTRAFARAYGRTPAEVRAAATRKP
jgi:AraC-like DNA-binding protein